MRNAIKDHMTQNGFRTDAALAEAVGCARSVVTRIRLGKISPSLGLAVKIGKAIKLPAETFLAEKDKVA